MKLTESRLKQLINEVLEEQSQPREPSNYDSDLLLLSPEQFAKINLNDLKVFQHLNHSHAYIIVNGQKVIAPDVIPVNEPNKPIGAIGASPGEAKSALLNLIKAAKSKTRARVGPPVETPEEKAAADAMEKELAYTKPAAAKPQAQAVADRKPEQSKRLDRKNVIQATPAKTGGEDIPTVDDGDDQKGFTSFDDATSMQQIFDILKDMTPKPTINRAIRRLKNRGKYQAKRGRMFNYLLSLPIKHPARVAFRKLYRQRKQKK